MAKQCLHEECALPVFGGKYCQRHQYLREDLKARKEAKNGKQEKVVKTLNQISDTEKKRQAIYQPIARAFRQANPVCAIKAPGCRKVTEGVHHKKGKVGELLFDTEHFIPACNPCNVYVEQHHAWAVEQGFIEKRNTETTRYKNTYKPE